MAGGVYSLTAKGAASVAALGVPAYAPALAAAGVGVYAATREPKERRRVEILTYTGERPGMQFVPQIGVYVPTTATYRGNQALVDLFGLSLAGDYPAPYRSQDAITIARKLIGFASETAPAFKHHFRTVRDRLEAIEGANLPGWRKTFAIINTVVLPIYASNVLWHWYRPVDATKSNQFNAMVTWAAMFYALPVTSTSVVGLDLGATGEAFPQSMGEYLSRSTVLQTGLNPAQMRRTLYDVFWYLADWPRTQLGDDYGPSLQELRAAASGSLQSLADAYPMTDSEVWLIEGNLKVVDEIVWLANARVQQSIGVDFDEGAAWSNLVIQVVGAVMSAVAPIAGPAVGQAISTAGNAIQAIAAAAASGSLTGAQVQALGGLGVAFMLDEAAIRLGLSGEMQTVEDLIAG